MGEEKKVTSAGLMHLSIVYVVWGSTYLAIRVAVREGAGFTPFTMGFMRVIVAGIVLLLWAALRKQRVRPTRRELWILAGSGLLMWPIANGLLTWAETRADSGLAALLLGSLPIWMVLIESIIDRKRPGGALSLALLTGFAGIGLLSAPTLLSGVKADLWSIVALLVTPFAWALGSVLQARNPIDLGTRASSAYQMLFGSIGFLVLLLALNEPRPTPTPEAWLAWGYLVVFGGILAFTSYVTALKILPINVLMTYAYVNPVVALFLGWLILGEKITGWTITGAVLILAGVAGVFRERYR